MKFFFKLLWSFWSRREDWIKLLDEGWIEEQPEQDFSPTPDQKNRTMWGD